MFPDDADVARVRDAIFDPFEYLMLRHRHGHLKTDFKQSLGSVSYHVSLSPAGAEYRYEDPGPVAAGTGNHGRTD